MPAVVEIHLLEDANGRYGFLLESPEPLDWRHDSVGRITLALGSGAQAVSAPSLAPSLVRVVSCDIANELIEVLVTDDLDVSGFAVDRVVVAGGAEATTPIHQFAAGTTYRGGTLVRLAIQRAAGTTTGPDAVEIGLGAQTRLLGGQTETIRIVDSSGREVHRRSFLPLAAYTAQNVVTATDPDGTRTFIFVRAADRTWNANLPDATYQFTLQYRRDAGAKRPILRRGGSTASEQALLSFSVPAALP